MSIAIDIILVLFIVGGFISGRLKGFVVTVMNFVSFIVAAVGTYILYPIPADYMYSKLFLPQITSAIEGAVLSEGNGLSLSELFASKPNAFVEILNRYSTVVDVEKFYNSGEGMTVTDICEFMASPIARTISNVLSFLLVFLVLLILLKLVTKLLDKICKLPVLRTANKLLGMALGTLMGLSLAWVIASVIAALIPDVSAAYPEVFSPTTIEDSVVLRWLCSFNPLRLFK